MPSRSSQTQLPSGEPLLGLDALGAFVPYAEEGAAAAVTSDRVAVNGPGFTEAWRIVTTRQVGPPWAVALKAGTVLAIAAGGVVSLRFWARSPRAGRFDVFVRKFGHNSNIEAAIEVGDVWQEFVLSFFSEDAFAAGAGPVFEFRFGFPPQTVEIGGVDVRYFGTATPLSALPRTRFSYAGRERGAAWRIAAEARIETQRKRDLRVRVVDTDGRPIPGAAVRLKQTRSAFHFGAALQMRRLVQDSPDNRLYRQKVLELFNAAGTENDLKWVVCAGDWGDTYSHEQTLLGLAWLRAHGLHARGHVLVWPGWNDLPRYIKALRDAGRADEIPAAIRDRIATITRATEGLLDEWDVINEPCDSRDLTDLFGRGIMAEWFHLARAGAPRVPLYLNDFGNHDEKADPAHVAHFEETARFLQERGAPIGGLGIQSHMTGQPSAPEQVLATLDRYARLGLPVRFTEFDIWTDDEELQADYTRDFLTLAYSHASVVGVQFWGFWEAAHWRRNAAFFRTDWSEKPNGRAYRELVLDRWRTRAHGATDVTGVFGARGFHGDYTVEVESAGRTRTTQIVLAPGTEAAEFVLTLPTLAHPGS